MATKNICEQRVATDQSRRRFGGLRTAQALKSDLLDVTLIDRDNYHLYQPLLNQVGTGSLSPGEISAPLRSLLNRQKVASFSCVHRSRR